MRDVRSDVFSETAGREDSADYEISSSLVANQTAYNVSKLLNNLLLNYDSLYRPDFGGESYQYCSVM